MYDFQTLGATPPERVRMAAHVRFARDIERLHRLGPKPLAHLIIDLAASGGDLEAVLPGYLGLDPAIVRALGADRPLPPVLREVAA